MAPAMQALLTDPTTYATLATALLTATCAAYRANDALLKSQRGPSSDRPSPSLSEQLIDENTRTLEGSMALAFPLIAAFSLLFLFFFLGAVGAVLTALSTISGLFSVIFLLWPAAEAVTRRVRGRRGGGGGGKVEGVLAGGGAVAVVGWWLFTGHWVPNDIIGVGLCVLFASLCKVPSLRVNAMLFAGLFAYDIFFVFFSERVFGRNVMVEVATSTPTNPASAIAEFLHLPVAPVRTLALPAKLMFPAGAGHYSILGLGDVILPEVLLVYLLEFDLRSRGGGGGGGAGGYFGRALMAYAVGLFASFYCSFAFQAAQPALLYIVPAMLLPTVALAKSRGQLTQLWRGLPRSEENEDRSDSFSRNGDEAASFSAGAKEQENAALLA